MQIFYKLRRKTVPVDSEIGTIPSTGLTVEQVQRRRQSGVPQPHRPQQVVQDPGTQTQQNRQEERAELLRDMDGHGLSEQTAEKAALTVRSVLIGDGGDAAIHIQLAPL